MARTCETARERVGHTMRLSVDRINETSPYWVIQLEDMVFRFVTKNGVIYRVGFYHDHYFLKEGAYHFFIDNSDNTFAPRDPDVFKVVTAVIEEFFRHQTAVMLYICEPEDHREKTRAALYKRWFEAYPNHEKLTLRTAEIDFKGYVIYSGMIIRNDHPLHDIILEAFDAFTKNAPQVYDVQPK